MEEEKKDHHITKCFDSALKNGEFKTLIPNIKAKFSAKKAAWYFHEGEYHKRNGKVYNMEDLRNMWESKQYENQQKVLEG